MNSAPVASGGIAMRIALAIAVLGMPTLATAQRGGGHHGGGFGAAPHGHSINAWMGSHHPKLR